jgi:large subunit ribosomal protein L15
MKLHDLRPPEGSNTARTRVGRGIAAGKGKTAGRGTKGQKARAGGSIPPWFEGGQTPLHMRIPKLRGFKNRFKVAYEVVNVGDIAARIEDGAFAKAGTAPKKGEQLTINADILRAVGLVRDVKKPLKILGNGELSTALFVVADAFTKSAGEKIEAAGGTVSVLEIPTESRRALGLDQDSTGTASEAGTAPAPAKRARKAEGAQAPAAEVDASAVGGAAPTADAASDGSATADGPEVESADVAEADDASPADEPAESPDAVADSTDGTPVTGDETATDSASVPGDESA